MSAQSRLAVEITKGDDFLNIWVDANNNGVRDDDDVNIFVSKSGHLFAESVTFKQTLDAHLKQRLQEASVALMTAGHDATMEDKICDLALELVVQACRAPEVVAAQPASDEATYTSNGPEYTGSGIPIYRPQN